MSADHKRPLLAFLLVAIACALIVANAARSNAMRSFVHHGVHRVVAGAELALQHDEHDRAPATVVVPPAGSAPFDRVAAADHVVPPAPGPVVAEPSPGVVTRAPSPMGPRAPSATSSERPPASPRVTRPDASATPTAPRRVVRTAQRLTLSTSAATMSSPRALAAAARSNHRSTGGHREQAEPDKRAKHDRKVKHAEHAKHDRKVKHAEHAKHDRKIKRDKHDTRTKHHQHGGHGQHRGRAHR